MRTLSPDEARIRLTRWLGLARLDTEPGPAGVRAVLARLRCIQLDPLDPLGTNADLVAMARVDGLVRGDVHRALAGVSFEHFAKMRCLLPADAFPAWRGEAAEVLWWKQESRLARLPDGLLDAVREDVARLGPVAASDLPDRGKVDPLDWNGWKGTSSAAHMAIEVLWTRCLVVAAGRSQPARGGTGQRLYDLPERALSADAFGPAPPFDRYALLERARACGLLPANDGPQWGALSRARKDKLADRLVAEGALCRIQVGARRYFAVPEFLAEGDVDFDDRVRILGPLDPLLWDRRLVADAFGFDYVWEVYKPKAQRRWGWYVVPLLHRARLVGRVDGRIEDGVLVVRTLFREQGVSVPEGVIDEALHRHARQCGADRVEIRASVTG